MTSDDKITFLHLQAIANAANINLVALMQNSVLVNGGTNQQADLITQYLNGFTNNNQNMLPLIYFPNWEGVNISEIILAKGHQNAPSSNWVGNKFTNGLFPTPYTIRQTEMISTALFVISVDTPTGLGSDMWLPWRRCWCSRGTVIYEGGQPTGMSSYGLCSKTNGNSTSDDRCGRCERSNFSGECNSDPCPGC